MRYDPNQIYQNKEEFVKLPPKERVYVISSSSKMTLIAAVVGLIGGIITSIASLSNILEYFNDITQYISKKHGSINIMINNAYAAQTDTQVPRFSGELKTVIVSGIFLALFILFLWCLITLSKSSNPKAVDAAEGLIKTLAGFFIGAITGFLGV